MAKGFLARLRTDVRGNALAIMAAALIPLCAFAGGAVDASRMYVVKTRLQTACDAGALAGRKFLDTTAVKAGDPLSGTALTQANSYFDNNFGSSWASSGWYTTGTQVRTWGTFADTNGTTQVSGAVQADVPMTLMRMFGFTSQTLKATCQASFDTPDTDVMFVLDTTGSMACVPSAAPDADCSGSTQVTLSDGSVDYYDTEVSGSKMQAVRDSVKTFYETLAANSSTGTFIRYGFVPYSSTVNVGAAIAGVNPNYLATSWTYQSRQATGDYQTAASTPTTDSTVKTQTACNAITVPTTRVPAAKYTYDASSGTATARSGAWSNNACKVTTYTYGPVWTYQPVTYDTTSYLATLGKTAGVDDPSKVGPSTSVWQGCIEEVMPVAGTHSYNSVSSYNIDALPRDLDPSWIPSSSNDTKWGPMWPAAVYGRNSTYATYQGTAYGWNGYSSTNTVTSNLDSTSQPDPYATKYNSSMPPSTPNYIGPVLRQSGFIPCPNPVMRLTDSDKTTENGTAYITENDVMNYVNNLHPHGGTYHDTGMIWGLRMLWPNGAFGADTGKHQGHADPKRVIVFLTDGAMAPSTLSYGMYGVEYFDGRISGQGSSITNASLADYHNARFLTQCQKAAEKNIQVWVVAVGQSLTQPLKDCVGAAHPERAVFVNSSTDLQATFKQIAKAVSMLRVSQ